MSPDAVPIYDGVGAPDEPYRYVAPPDGATVTAPPTQARATSPVTAGVTTAGISLRTAEVGPQMTLFLPPRALAATSGPVVVEAVPRAPADGPPGSELDGNAYEVTVTSPSGTTSLSGTTVAPLLSLRATTARQPGPTIHHRAGATGQWQPLRTTRGGVDFYVATYAGPGSYVLAFLEPAAGTRTSWTPYVVLVGLLVLVAVVVVVRLRAAE